MFLYLPGTLRNQAGLKKSTLFLLKLRILCSSLRPTRVVNVLSAGCVIFCLSACPLLVPQLFVLVYEVVAGKFGAANLAGKELDVDVLDVVSRVHHAVVALFSSKEEGVEMSALVLLVAVAGLKHVVAEQASVGLVRGTP